MIQEKDIRVPVRDGVKIDVRVYRPRGSGRFPASRSPMGCFHVYRPDKIGSDTIHHDAAHPSHLALPVLDAK